MQRIARPRRYVSSGLLTVLRPLFRYDYARSAYVMRLVGERYGPVLRDDRRRRQRSFEGAERRGQVLDAHASLRV
ncbi:MAG TPA: hypothetical protein VIK04_02645 [Solirubrobacteraceae bacterium]